MPEAPPIVGEVLRSAGSPLDPPVRRDVERLFGRDFADVRVHAGVRAAESARAVDAHAYTVGRHVVFGDGGYAPGTPRGRRLLAHELAHVVQQGAATDAPGPLALDDPGGAAEREAQAVAGRIAAGRPAGAVGAQPVRLQAANGGAGVTPTPAAPAHEVTAIRLGHREDGGLGRFDTLLYRSCEMKVQMRLNFNFLGAWPSEAAKRDWQSRFITSVQTAWSRKYKLTASGPCTSGCAEVVPFVELYAPHSAPHVTVDVTWTTSGITSSAGYGVAHLDSMDLTPELKHEGTEEMVPAVHEFGHLTGRPDLYRAGGTCAPGYPLTGIMCFGNTVQPVDYEPFAHALDAMTGCTYAVGAAP